MGKSSINGHFQWLCWFTRGYTIINPNKSHEIPLNPIKSAFSIEIRTHLKHHRKKQNLYRMVQPYVVSIADRAAISVSFQDGLTTIIDSEGEETNIFRFPTAPPNPNGVRRQDVVGSLLWSPNESAHNETKRRTGVMAVETNYTRWNNWLFLYISMALYTPQMGF